MSDVLYIAAKAPHAGVVKTRLGTTIGHEHAVVLYRAFLHDLAARFATAPFAVGWYITPPDAWPELAPVVGNLFAQVTYQGEGDWTERQRCLFRAAASRGEERVILVASDSPQLSVTTVAAAFRQLEQHDVVLGPTQDGGYYLIGMRGWHDVLGTIPMSTHTVLRDILTQAWQSGVSVGLVETLFDIDEAVDLGALQQVVETQPDLVATRAALATLPLSE